MRIESLGTGKVYANREYLFQEGDECEDIFLILRGRLEVTQGQAGREERIAELENGDVFGKMALFQKGGKIPFTVRAIGEAQVLTVNSLTLKHWIGEDPLFALNTVRKLNRTTQTLRNAMKINALKKNINFPASGKVYANHECIFCEGDESKNIFLVQRGSLEVIQGEEGQEERVDMLKVGDIFGVMAYCQKKQKSFFAVRAIGEAQVLAVDKRTLISWIEDDPMVAMNIIKRLGQRVRYLDRKIFDSLPWKHSTKQTVELKSPPMGFTSHHVPSRPTGPVV
ncbi:MAG: cyclic nucleotide-binding domain-containing protein [Pseudomonadota bacterium]